MLLNQPRQFLEQCFWAAVRAADPSITIQRHLPKPPKGRLVVVGAGKAASQMAAAFEESWGLPCEGLVVTQYGPVAPTEWIKVMQSAHPLPDEAGLSASQCLLQAVSGLQGDDLVIALISGGGSALLPAPPLGFTLADEIELNRVLLASGAPIAAMNCLRKHFSLIKGGRLALAAAPAQVISLVVSDIPGDNPAYVASGPTIPDEATAADALQIIQDYRLPLSRKIIDYIATNVSPHPLDSRFHNHQSTIIASAKLSLEATARTAKAQGINAIIISDQVEGEAKDIGLMHAALAKEIVYNNRPFSKPVLLLSGGETTVTLGQDTSGKGGRNTEFLLSFALAIDGVPGIFAMAADTDGIDGVVENAGAFCDSTTALRMRQQGILGRERLFAHDSWSVFQQLGDNFAPGKTGTNVNDFRAILITPP